MGEWSTQARSAALRAFLYSLYEMSHAVVFKTLKLTLNDGFFIFSDVWCGIRILLLELPSGAYVILT